MKLQLKDQISFHEVKQAALLLRAVNNNYRQKILILLEQNLKLTVTEIRIHLRLPQSVTSFHLSILRRAHLVKTFRDGKNNYYELNPDGLGKIHDFTLSLLKE